MASTRKVKTKENHISPSVTETSENNEFLFKGVVYDSYEEMVKAKRQRNANMLVQSGLMEAAAQMKGSLTNKDKTEASKRGLRADRKRKETSVDLQPRRISTRLKGIQAEDIFIADELRGGKIVLGGSIDSTAVLSASNIYIDEKKETFFKNRVNDGSPLNVKEAVELAGYKWVKEDSVSAAESFMNSLKLTVKETSFKSAPSPRGFALDMSTQLSKLNVDSEDCVAKVVPDRIYSVAFHPSESKLISCAGDKQGHLGIWDVDNHTENSDGVHLFRPHSSPISNLEWTRSGNKLLSSSYDGTVKLFDISSQTFLEVFASYDESPQFKEKLGFGLDEGHKFWIQYTCFGETEDTLFLSTSLGGVVHVDLRSKGRVAFDLTLSEKKINTVSLHPNGYTMATAGLDCTVNLWDIRKFATITKGSNLQPLAYQNGSKSVNSAFFSPSGKHLLTTTMSNTLEILSDSHLKTGLLSKPAHRIRHDNMTGRWLSTFMAQWHPSLINEDLFIVGSMSKPRRMEFFNGNTGKVYDLQGDALTAVVSRCCFHPSTERLIACGGNSSGRVTVAR